MTQPAPMVTGGNARAVGATAGLTRMSGGDAAVGPAPIPNRVAPRGEQRSVGTVRQLPQFTFTQMRLVEGDCQRHLFIRKGESLLAMRYEHPLQRGSGQSPGDILCPPDQSDGFQPPRRFEPAKGVAIPSATVESTTGGSNPGTLPSEADALPTVPCGRPSRHLQSL